jgi:hypothetical protein
MTALIKNQICRSRLSLPAMPYLGELGMPCGLLSRDQTTRRKFSGVPPEKSVQVDFMAE